MEEKEKRTLIHPAVILLILLAAGAAAAFLIPEGGISRALWGFEEHRFTVGEEEITLRLDTSGPGSYEVECRDNRVTVIRRGTVLWEGGFFSQKTCGEYQQKARDAGDCRVLEDGTGESPALICSYPEGGGTGYALMVRIDGSACGAVFHTPDGSAFTEQEALEYAHRLRFEKQD